MTDVLHMGRLLSGRKDASNRKINMKTIVKALQNYILENEIRIMEVCGTHTREFFKTGVKDIFPDGLSLVDGPGCPVCVTPNEYLDRAIEIGKSYNVILTTFGDMMKVPSSYSSLMSEKATGMEIDICYSPTDALKIAINQPDKEIIFLSLGFETTSPAEASIIMQAKSRNIKNFSLLCGNKITVPAVRTLLDSGEANIDGFILPGHVSSIIGSDAWNFIASEYKKPGVVAGFEAEDLVKATLIILDLITNKNAIITNEYIRAVRNQGNLKAMEIMHAVFEQADSNWRGIGIISSSGLYLKDNYADFDAAKRFPVDLPPVREHAGCKCGELLKGLIIPTDCPLFGKACSPESPVGPCMVSSEGPCSAYYFYRKE
jgi:hydrogenase expression/formation protein HypD